MKVYVSPHPSIYAEDGVGSGGIWRVINAQAKYLPKHGIQIVEKEEDAELVIIHAGALIRTDKPIVTCSHGLYWTGDFEWARNYWQYNAAVVEALRRAVKVTTPSEWVAYPIKRDMRKVPVVIPHGVDVEEFDVQTEHKGYVLWGKPRIDIVCDPRVVDELAERVPEVPFVTTFGRPTGNVTVTGAMPYVDFQKVIDGAMVWLATARETGDIGSREAMARGIPVLGWNHGGTAELIRHKETGYLAENGNLDDLVEGLHYCIQYRNKLGRNARADIEANHQWKHIIPKYAATFEEALSGENYLVEISLVVPTYNYAHYLDECLNSIKEQTFYKEHMGKVETIVVDDCSTDDTQIVLSHHTWPGLQTIRHDTNRGLCAALNTGHDRARGKYVTNLDADNLLPPNALELLYEGLESKPWIDVASGMIAMYSEDGNHHKATDWPFGEVDPLAQLNHINQQPSSSMMRRRSVERLGGYRLRQRKNEDGEFWCRAVSAGLRFEQVTQEPVLVYRWHGGNKSRYEGGEDDPNGPLSWNFYYPWRNRYGIMPFASTAPSPLGSWAVRSYGDPHISVIVPVGPGHQNYLVDALDSIAGQTYQNFECIVANDTGEPLDTVAMGHPWVRVVDTGGRRGPAIARNTAIAASRAPLIAPLDADDLFYPDWLARAYQAWLQFPEDLVYGDCEIEDGIGDDGHVHSHPYESGPWSYEGKRGIRADAIYQSPILFAKQWWEAVGGYPTDTPYGMWEDWLFGVLLHIGGVGATYLKTQWGRYRHWTAGELGSKNAKDNEGYGTEEFKKKLVEVYRWIEEREKKMPCRGCGGRNTRVVRPGMSASTPKALDGEFTVIYEGDRKGGFGMNSKAYPGRKIRVEYNKPMTLNNGDRWVAELPGMRLITDEEKATPEFPKSPPSAPEVKFDAPQPPPNIADIPPMPNAPSLIIPEEERPKEQEEDKYDGLVELSTVLSDFKLSALRGAGFDSMDKIRVDIETNSGNTILTTPGIGPTTLRKIRRVALG